MSHKSYSNLCICLCIVIMLVLVYVYNRERAGVKVSVTEGGLELIVSSSELISLVAHVLCKEV